MQQNIVIKAPLSMAWIMLFFSVMFLSATQVATPFNGYAYGTNTSLLAQCNDFANINRTAFFVQDATNKLSSATFCYNKLGYDSSLAPYGERHMVLQCATNAPPTLTLQGNRFYNANSLTADYQFDPPIINWVTNFPPQDLGWNATNGANAYRYKINNPNGYQDSSFSYY